MRKYLLEFWYFQYKLDEFWIQATKLLEFLETIFDLLEFIERRQKMSKIKFILLVETCQAELPHNITILEHQIISLKSLIYSYNPDSGKRDGIRALFGDNVFSYGTCNRFGTIGYKGNVSTFVEQSFNGHMSSDKEVIPVLNAFIGGCNQNQNNIIQKTYTHLENIYKESTLDELKQARNNLRGVIISWKEKIQEYSNLKIVLPYEDATCVLNHIDSILQDMEDYKPFCRILTALGYFALCFLSLTENAYVNQLNAEEERKRKFEAVKLALPKLLKSIKEFLEEPLSQSKLDRKEATFDKSGDDHPRTLGSTYEDHSNIPAARSRRTYTGFSQEMIEKIEEYVFYNMAKWLKESLTITQFESVLRSFLQKLYEDGILDIDYIEYAKNYYSYYYSLFQAVLECLKDFGRDFTKELVEKYSKRLEQYEKIFAEEGLKEYTKSNNDENTYERNQ